MRLNSLSRFVNYCTEFGVSTAYGYIIKPYIHKRKALPDKHQAVKDYLYHWASKYTDISHIRSSSNNMFTQKDIKDNTIWICWLQGEENMPEVIKLCYNSVKRMAGDRSVVLISFSNLNEYVTIPASIYNKLKQKKISLTHFADYLRILLLKTYGGLWIDASIYITKPIDFVPTKDELYTIKSRKINDVYVSDCRWTVSLIGCTKGNLLFYALEFLMRKYIEDHRSFIDFFLFDYLIAILYEHNSAIQSMINRIHYNNEKFYLLQDYSNTAYDDHKYRQLINDQIYHKLSWKSTYHKFTEDGQPTFYSHISDKYQ